jgi:Tat protein translocase TatC
VNFLSEPLGDEPVQTQEQFDQQSLTEHLRELRSCLLIAFAAVAAGFAVALQLCSAIGRLVSPASDQGFAAWQVADLHVLSGRVFFYLKLALVCGVVLASPVIFLQIWRFVSPGLYRHERKAVLVPFTVISTLCFVGGAAFGYFVVFPPAFRFLLGYSNAFLEPMPAVGEYFSLALRLFLAFGVIFELPVFMVFLAKIGMVNKPFLVKHRKYAISDCLCCCRHSHPHSGRG